MKPRQIEPSNASTLHLAGLKSLSVFMKLGMNTSGIMPPPNIAISMFAPHAAPDTASSVLPITDISIMMPTKQKAMQTAATASSSGTLRPHSQPGPERDHHRNHGDHGEKAGGRLAGERFERG